MILKAKEPFRKGETEQPILAESYIRCLYPPNIGPSNITPDSTTKQITDDLHQQHACIEPQHIDMTVLDMAQKTCWRNIHHGTERICTLLRYDTYGQPTPNHAPHKQIRSPLGFWFKTSDGRPQFHITKQVRIKHDCDPTVLFNWLLFELIAINERYALAEGVYLKSIEEHWLIPAESAALRWAKINQIDNSIVHALALRSSNSPQPSLFS